MIDPSLAFQTAVRGVLTGCPVLSEMVPAGQVRAGSTRPDLMPGIVLADARAEILGRASGGYRVARVFLTLHVWAAEDADDTARQIGGAILGALEFGPKDSPGFHVDEWHQPAVTWLRDAQPDGANVHGVMTLEAAVRWKV